MAVSRLAGPVLLLLATLALTAMVAQPTEHTIYFGLGSDDGHGLMADTMDQLSQELMMESASARRHLAGKQGGHISYAAMGRNNVPCNRRGQSYYNCNSHQKANPYTRGCTRATQCARTNH
ncbi:Protein RALF-like 4 [Striga hermonthica]|uniref:Protein RALF-like 4 n=1 Tax=Striga hermonthica TaxID=68872 RepID=A0A9N7MUE1_STRHE|nr:Protein RALF-like 4 [Striga hermonthica]